MEINRISIKTGRVSLFVDIASIVFMKAENIYSCIYLTDGKKILASHKIGDMEKKLNGTGFFKTHRSYLINTRFVTKYSKAEAALYLQGYDTPIPVSRNFKHAVEALLIS